MAERLSRGMAFPATTITLSGGGTMTLPNDMGEGYKLVLIYRGMF
ncbi:MAG: hypothetical protein RIM84_00585 [Alphaproteobacteria bacterium]